MWWHLSQRDCRLKWQVTFGRDAFTNLSQLDVLPDVRLKFSSSKWLSIIGWKFWFDINIYQHYQLSGIGNIWLWNLTLSQFLLWKRLSLFKFCASQSRVALPIHAMFSFHVLESDLSWLPLQSRSIYQCCPNQIRAGQFSGSCKPINHVIYNENDKLGLRLND
jgi:hypothetical protein